MRKINRNLTYLEILEKNKNQVDDIAEARRLSKSLNNVTWTKRVALKQH